MDRFADRVGRENGGALTGREIRLRRTCKTERVAQIELGKLLEQAAAGRQPETNATVAELTGRYAEVAGWDLSAQKANEFYIRRVIKPALGHLQVRKVGQRQGQPRSGTSRRSRRRSPSAWKTLEPAHVSAWIRTPG